MQAALLAVQNHCTEAQKGKFSDLFALADEHEIKPSKKKTAANKKKARNDSASESDASEVSLLLPRLFVLIIKFIYFIFSP